MDEFDRVRAALADARAAGVDFGHAWEAAMADVPTGPAMRAAMKDTRHAWARAYGGRLTDADRRLLELAWSTDATGEACETVGVLVA